MTARNTKTAQTPSAHKNDVGSDQAVLTIAPLMSRLKNRWTLFFLLALVLTAMWYGPYVVSSGVGILDTNKELYYFEYFRQNIRAGSLPFFFVAPPGSLAWYPAMRISHAAFANPEVYSFSPDMLLMLFLPLVTFLKVHFALHFLVGIFGIYLVSKRLGLRVEFALGLLMLVLLNPWFLQHLAIGYSPWINVAFYPLIAALLIGTERGKYDTCYAGIINALLLYQGGLHPFVWFNGTALLVVVLYSARYRTVTPLRRILAFYCVSACAGLPKLLMAGSIWGGMKQKLFPTYDSFEGLWAILTDRTMDPFGQNRGVTDYHVFWYDGSLYMGVFFPVLVALSMLIAAVREKWLLVFNALLIPAIIMVIISWGTNWSAFVSGFESVTEAILSKPVYALRAEKYPWRFLFLGVVLISTFAMIQFSRFVSAIERAKVRIPVSCAFCVLLALIGNNLWARNHFFSQAATQTDAAWVKEVDIRNSIHQAPVLDMNQKRIPLQWPDGNIGSNRFEIPAHWFGEEGAVILPWLKMKDATLFDAENCHADKITYSKPSDIRTAGRPEVKYAWLAPDGQVAVIKIKDPTKNVILTYDMSRFYVSLIIGLLGVATSFVIANIAGRAKRGGETLSAAPQPQ